jgi:hypothetical protein
VERGDVHLIPISLPNRVAPGGNPVPTSKYVVVLRGGVSASAEAEVPVLIASTDRRQVGQQVRPFEVSAGLADGFTHATIIDCRWPYTLEKANLPQSTYRFRLGLAKMAEISTALVSGLQMYPPAAQT